MSNSERMTKKSAGGGGCGGSAAVSSLFHIVKTYWYQHNKEEP